MKSVSPLYSSRSLPKHRILGFDKAVAEALGERTGRRFLGEYGSAGGELPGRFSDWQRCSMQIRFAQHSQFMKFSLSLAFVVAFFLSSCSEPPPPQRTRHPVANYPPAQTEQYPPQQQPFNPNGPVQPQGTPREEGAASPVPTAAPTKVAKGDYPYGIPVPGKPHLVESPFSPGKYVDVEGFPPGTEVKDPYTDKIFLVP